jgi:small multidrug resistance pump
MIISWISAFGSVFLTGVGQTLLKIGARKIGRKDRAVSVYLNPYVITAYGLFFMVTMFSVYALKEINLKVLSSLASLNFFIVMLLSYLVLKETANKGQIIGIGLVIFGIIIFNK